jgi:2-polyprenyl-3-methyl-5-hydroxy-6-metoxy-1,4-benzoquinol methylase
MKRLPALIIDQPLELSGWRELVLDRSVRLQRLAGCPCCGAPCEDFVSLVGDAGEQEVIIGRCQSCGWIGYRDRPSLAWLEQFYLSEWDTGRKGGRSADVSAHSFLQSRSKANFLAAELARPPAGGLRSNSPRCENWLCFGSLFHSNCEQLHADSGTDSKEARGEKAPSRNTRALLSLVERLTLDRDLSRILEIGCGYGGALNALRDRGFRNLFGVENSTHRALVAQGTTGAEVLIGDFASPHAQQMLTAAGPFDLVFSSHVLEHIADPFAFLTAARSLQSPGGTLIISMPNQLSEPAAAIVFFLPHLHSLTLLSLTTLLDRAAYDVTDASATTDAELFVLAHASAKESSQKSSTTPPQAGESGASDYDALTKFAHELAFNGLEPRAAYHRLWWHRKDNTKSGRLPALKPPLLEKLHYTIEKLRNPALKNARSVLVHDASERHTAAPIEFQFNGPVRLFYK